MTNNASTDGTDAPRLYLTLALTEQDACDLIQGTVPHFVLVAVISGVIALHETAEESVASMKARKKRSAA